MQVPAVYREAGARARSKVQGVGHEAAAVGRSEDT